MHPDKLEIGVLGQENSTKPLKDPSQCKNVDQSQCYETLADHIQELHQLDSMPMTIDLSRLGLSSRQRIAEAFTQHNAKWHKTCYRRFSEDNVQRARKKVSKLDNAQLNTSPLKGRLRCSFPIASSQTNEK